MPFDLIEVSDDSPKDDRVEEVADACQNQEIS